MDSSGCRNSLLEAFLGFGIWNRMHFGVIWRYWNMGWDVMTLELHNSQ